MLSKRTMSILRRRLLGSTSESDCSYDPYDSLTDAVSDHSDSDAFTHIYYLMIFVALLWIVGKLFCRLGMPALVGEIVIGIAMGPNALQLIDGHDADFLIVIGEIGLILLVVEAGIDVDIGMLKLIGPRGLGIALLGSAIPLLMGMSIALGFGNSIQCSIAIGSCFAPTSMGIALNVLKEAKILNTPTGQLIIAAAILDDVLALIILSELTAMKDPSIQNILLPLLVSPALILLMGYLSIRWTPRLIKLIMGKIPSYRPFGFLLIYCLIQMKQHHENGILLLLFVSAFSLIPACNYAGSSYLLGAFLSGLMFCTDHTIHHVWNNQIKRILQWMLRVFFGCTIGFAIPVQQFTSTAVLKQGFIYCVVMAGKLITGLFGRPLNQKEFLTVGFSMSAWGEFAFIIATASYEDGTIDEESFSAVLLAVLLSVIVSPYGLRLTLKHFEQHAQRKMNAKLKKYESSHLHPVYFAILTKARGQWGHQDKILHEIFKLDLEIIDFRSWHAPEYNFTHHLPLTKESFYVMDSQLQLPPTKHLTEGQKQRLRGKVKMIRNNLRAVLGEKSVIQIKRWLPGVPKKADEVNKTDKMLGEKICRQVMSPSYCRRAAFKQAHLIMSSRDLKLDKIDESKESRPSGKLRRFLKHSDGTKGAGKRLSAAKTELALAEVIAAEESAATDHHLGAPEPLGKSQSSPNPPVPQIDHKLKVTAMHLLRQLSAPENYSYTGTGTGHGHGGQGKGAGALPFTNNMINIHDHLEENENEDDLTLDREEEGDDDSCSYIYGDEDAEHHYLPQFDSPKASPKKKMVSSRTSSQQDTQSITDFHLESGAVHVVGPQIKNGSKMKEEMRTDAVPQIANGHKVSVTESANFELAAEIAHDIEIVMTDIESDSTMEAPTITVSKVDQKGQSPINDNEDGVDSKE